MVLDHVLSQGVVARVRSEADNTSTRCGFEGNRQHKHSGETARKTHPHLFPSSGVYDAPELCSCGQQRQAVIGGLY